MLVKPWYGLLAPSHAIVNQSERPARIEALLGQLTSFRLRGMSALWVAVGRAVGQVQRKVGQEALDAGHLAFGRVCCQVIEE